MCGILGLFSEQVELNNFEKSLNLMRHRGPNDSGISDLGNNILFGHCRLSIQDLTKNGAQPMTSDDERYSIVYNGEIYNFKELRQSLIKLGYTFKSDSDTEVLLKMYSLHNIEMINSLRGDFAIAIYDSLNSETIFFFSLHLGSALR